MLAEISSLAKEKLHATDSQFKIQVRNDDQLATGYRTAIDKNTIAPTLISKEIIKNREVNTNFSAEIVSNS